MNTAGKENGTHFNEGQNLSRANCYDLMTCVSTDSVLVIVINSYVLIGQFIKFVTEHSRQELEHSRNENITHQRREEDIPDSPEDNSLSFKKIKIQQIR